MLSKMERGLCLRQRAGHGGPRAVCLRRNERMGMYRAMTVLSVIGVLAALYFLYQYGMY